MELYSLCAQVRLPTRSTFRRTVNSNFVPGHAESAYCHCLKEIAKTASILRAAIYFLYEISEEVKVQLSSINRGCPKVSGKLGGGTIVYYAATAQFSSVSTSFFASFRPRAAESIHKSL